MQFGVDNEPVARCLYYEKYCETHKGANIKQTGLFIDAKYPILGASPDGIVSCHCCCADVLSQKSFLINIKTKTQVQSLSVDIILSFCK
jgi:hypothetical protein